MEKEKTSLFGKITQILLPIFTIVGFGLTSLKMPEIGITVSLLSQVFWLYAGWKAWKKAGQIGIFINSVVVTFIFLFGVINYWFL